MDLATKLNTPLSPAEKSELAECVEGMRLAQPHVASWWECWRRIEDGLLYREAAKDTKTFLAKTFGDGRLFEIVSAHEVAAIVGVKDVTGEMIGALAVFADFPEELQRIAVAKLPEDATVEDAQEIADAMAVQAMLKELPEQDRAGIFKYRDDRARGHAEDFDIRAKYEKLFLQAPRYLDRARKGFVTLASEEAAGLWPGLDVRILEKAIATIHRLEKEVGAALKAIAS